MNKETTLKLLNRFVDYNRNNMNKPFSQDLKIGKYLCATDAKIVVLIPETEENKIEDVEGYKPPNIDGILPEFKEPFDLDFKYLKKLFDKVPIIERFKMDECEACDGDGKFEHYGDWYECKNCDELGEVQSHYKEKVKSPETAFRFKDVDISISKIQSIMEIQFALQKTEFEFKIMKLGKGTVWFKLDEIYIGIVALRDIEDDKKKWTVIDIELKNLLQI
jgi:hypothetical protein